MCALYIAPILELGLNITAPQKADRSCMSVRFCLVEVFHIVVNVNGEPGIPSLVRDICGPTHCSLSKANQRYVGCGAAARFRRLSSAENTKTIDDISTTTKLKRSRN
jgi:hypothetical protein